MAERNGSSLKRCGWCGLAAVVALLAGPGCTATHPPGGGPGPEFSGSCAAISASFSQKAWTGGGLFGVPLARVGWPASGDWKDSVEHWCVHNNDGSDGIPDFAMHVLCGVETDPGKAIEFELESVAGYEGPTLHLTRGWAFITFHWPLIWMRNIQAGSFGTTAISRRFGDTAQTFLIRNAKQLGAGVETTDCDTGLSMRSGTGYPVEILGFEPGSGRDVVMCQHRKLPASEYLAPLGSGSGGGFALDLWYFDVSLDATGALVVTPADSGDAAAAEAGVFLREVLTIAREQEIYIVPADCPDPGP